MPVNDVKDGIAFLYDEAPDDLRCLVEYFDSVYVTGPIKALVIPNSINLRFRRIPPRFPPPVWNVHDATIEERDRTNNKCESWNNSFKHLVGHANPSLWTVVACLQKDAIEVSVSILRKECGELPKKRVKKGTKAHQQRLKRLCEQYNKREKNLHQFVNAMGKSIRITKPKKK